jgi:putative membrane protein
MNEIITPDLSTGDKLAVTRTQLALQRTQMAAVRTSVSMISFGFTIAKFFNDLKSIDSLKTISTAYSSSNVGYWLVLIGTAYIIITSVQYQFDYRALHIPGVRRRIPFTFLLSVVIGILGLVLIISFYVDYFKLGLNK